MLISEAAETYVRERNLARTPVYSAGRFAAVVGDLPVEQICQNHIDRFKVDAESKGWSAWTIRGTIKDIRTLTRHFCGFSPTVQVVVPTPDPDPTPIQDIDSIWKHLDPWARQWLVISYWCSMRLDDSLKVQLDIHSGKHQGALFLLWTAGKTGRKHRVPVPKWMLSFLSPVDLPYSKVNDWTQETVRESLKRASQCCGIDQVYPRNIRQRGLTEWKRASPDAGSIIHGSGLGILDHYIPPIEILQAAMHQVRLPACFGAVGEKSHEDDLLTSFRRLDPQGKDLVVMTAKRIGR